MINIDRTDNISGIVVVPYHRNRKMTSASGQWSSSEHLLFEKACVLFGWGRWKDITNWMGSQGCGRSRDQVKSHAQKFAQARPHERKRIGMMIHKPEKRTPSKMSTEEEVVLTPMTASMAGMMIHKPEKRTPSKMSTEKEVVLTPMTASMATALMTLKHTFVSTPNIFSP